jgi:outer membrane protein assembly factor BamB
MRDGETIVAARGSGYTPYYTVAVFDAQGTLVFHEQSEGWARGLTLVPDIKAFDVDTGTSRWRYHFPESPQTP